MTGAGGRIALLLGALGLLACTGPMERARQDLQHGRAAEVLRSLRPASAQSFLLRGAALARLGRADQALNELRLALALDDHLVEAYCLVGRLEVERGNYGAALDALERGVQRQPRRRCCARLLARLLAWRAYLRLHPAPGLLRRAKGRDELQRVARLDPCLERWVGRMRQAPGVVGPGGAWAPLPAGLCPGVAGGLDPLRSWGSGRPRGSGRSRGTGRSRGSWHPPGTGRCDRGRARDRVQRTLREALLLGCHGPEVALSLERQNCPREALQLWDALARRDPEDPRWSLQQGRALLALGRPARAKQLLTHHVYIASDRSRAMADVARVYLGASMRRHAAKSAVRAMALASTLAQQLDALSLLARSGTAQQVSMGADLVLQGGWTVQAEELRRRLRRALAPAATRETRRP